MEITKANRSQKGQQVPNFTEPEALAHIESLRWPNGPVCVHCGSTNVYRLKGDVKRRKLAGSLLECRDCREQFSVTVGTVMEDTHLPLAVWVKAFHYLCSSKKGMSALQLQRNLGLGSYRTAWFLAHRIREAMKCEPLSGKLKGDVQVDETYVGGKPRHSRGKKYQGVTEKKPVIAMVETNGKLVSKPIPNTQSPELIAAMQEHIDASARIITDEYPAYKNIAKKNFTGGHETVNHSLDEYVNAEGFTTNTAEGYFALLKRGIHGTFHHISRKHTHRYCHEFDFRWNGRDLLDTERRDAAVKGAEGKRLYYKSPVAKSNIVIGKKPSGLVS